MRAPIIAACMAWATLSLASTSVPVQYVLFRNAQAPGYALAPTVGGVWQPLGGAKSATAILVDNRDGLMPPVKAAEWNFDWMPGAPGPSSSGIRLMRADSGYLNPVQMGAFSINNAPAGPLYQGVDVTAAWNAMLAEHKYQFVWFEVVDPNDGSGAYPKVYSSDVFAVWSLP